MKLPETALPEGFMAAVEAIKRLKPAPKQTDSRERQPHGGRRFTATAAIKPGHSRGGPRRDSQRDGPRTEQPARDGQRHPQRADSHAAHRPATAGANANERPGQPKRPFRGRRGGGGRPGGGTGQRAHG